MRWSNASPATPARLADAISDVRVSGAAGHTARAAELDRRAREQARVERMGLVLTGSRWNAWACAQRP